MPDTILESVKESMPAVVYASSDFDGELLSFINMSTTPLYQVGCVNPMEITALSKWEEFIRDPPTPANYELAKSVISSYISLQTRLLFDPPVYSMADIFNEKVKELLWRIEALYEESD